MNLRRFTFIYVCLAIILPALGCTSIRRDHFLRAHSLDQFLVDRPQAATMLVQHPALEQWLRPEWIRPIGDYRIYWSDAPPTISMADHGFIPDDKLIVIRVSTKLLPADQLTALCFEICNAQEFSGIEVLVAQATAGKISRADYVRKKSEKEHQAVLRAGKVMFNLLPLSSDEISATNLYRHLIAAPAHFTEYDAWNRTIPNSNYQRTQRHYGEEYDKLRKSGP